ncbi:hypothetical protein DSO57_1032601 [Entomophthora muscae]|uniref:Uncharacterized protein n=1 Tax=Entomophthora muscae TaxID=34485 RepID=A0ACC2U9V2_9FUNG|nr:hypothetical protein DSO57_1032601 [Entomophthora muscae]
MHMMNQNFFYGQNQGMNLSAPMPYSNGLGTGAMMTPQGIMNVNSFSGHSFGQYGSLPTTNNGFQPQMLAQSHKMLPTQPLHVSFHPAMNGMYIPSNSSIAHMSEMGPRLNASLSRSGPMHQQNDPNSQQSTNFYNLSNYSQAFSNQMVNFNIGHQAPNSGVPISQKGLETLVQQVTLAGQQPSPAHHPMAYLMPQRAAQAHQQPTLPSQATSAGQQYYIPGQQQSYQQGHQPSIQQVQRGTPVQQHGTPSSQRGTPKRQPSTPGSQRHTPVHQGALTPQLNTPGSQRGTPVHQGFLAPQLSSPGSQRGTPVRQGALAPQRSTPVAQVSPTATPHQTPSAPIRTPSDTFLRTSHQDSIPQKPIEPDQGKANLPASTSTDATLQNQHTSPPVSKTVSQESTPLQRDSPKDEDSGSTSSGHFSRSDSDKQEVLRQRCLESREEFYNLLNSISGYTENPKSPVMFNDQPIDLHALWSSCMEFGGPVECGKSKSWAKVRERLDVDCPQSKVPSRLKMIWRKYLLSLESFLYPNHIPVLDPKKKKSDSAAPKAPIKLEPKEHSFMVDSPVASTDSPEEPATKKARYEHPPRTQAYDYIPFVLRYDTYGGVNVAQLYNDRAIPDLPGGEVHIHSLTMSLLSQMPMAVSASLTTLLTISLSVPIILDDCSRLTEALIDLIKLEFSAAFPNPPIASDCTYESLSKQFYEGTPDLRSKPTQSMSSITRLILIFTILRNFSFVPVNQLHLAKQTDLVGWFFLVVHSQFPKDCLAESLEIRKHLLVFLSNIIGYWIIDKDALKPTSRLPTQLPPQKLLDFICEFLQISSSPVYPSLALECLAKLTTFDNHRMLLAAAPLAPRCRSTLKTLSEILQDHFSNETEPIDEQKLVYLLHLLMSILNLINILGGGCDFPLFLPATLIRTAKWLARLEAFERGLKEPRMSKASIPNPSSYMNKVPLSKADRQDVLVSLAMRALLALNALFTLPSSQGSNLGGSNLLVSHRGTLVELMALPSIDATLTSYINTILNPVGNFLCPSTKLD